MENCRLLAGNRELASKQYTCWNATLYGSCGTTPNQHWVKRTSHINFNHKNQNEKQRILAKNPFNVKEESDRPKVLVALFLAIKNKAN